MKFEMKKTKYMKFKTQKHMVQELIDGKCFANCHGDVIRYDESFPNNPFRISRYADMNVSVPMTSGWNEFDQKIWVEVTFRKSSPLDIHSISIMTDKGEFGKIVLEEGVELEFNHTDHTMYFRPTAL
jgi:hypothetical protein